MGDEQTGDPVAFLISLFLLITILILGCILCDPNAGKNTSNPRAVVLTDHNIGKNTSTTVVRNKYEDSSSDHDFSFWDDDDDW